MQNKKNILTWLSDITWFHYNYKVNSKTLVNENSNLIITQAIDVIFVSENILIFMDLSVLFNFR